MSDSSSLAGRSLLVLGAGYVGGAFVREALARGLRVAVFTEALFGTGNDVDNRAAVRAVPRDKLDLVGVYGSYAEAEDAWRANAQKTVDDAEMRYVIVHLHKLLQPEA